jgi:hypothetical protein
VLIIDANLQATQQHATALAQQFSEQIVAARAQQQTTAKLAQQLRQQVNQAIQTWPEQEQQQFILWFNQALNKINDARKTDVPSDRHVGFYFAIVAGILAVSFIGLAVFAALMDAKTFNGG